MLQVKKTTVHRSSFTVNHLAFTLAEVLITLGIIGVVAALTIPSLMQKNQDSATVSKLKKVYSTLSNAYNFAVKDNGTPDTWGFTGAAYNATSSTIMITNIIPYLNVSQNCGTANGCFPNVTYKLLDNSSWANISTNGQPKLKLQDGISLTAVYEGGNCNNVWGSLPQLQTACGDYDVDINGDSPPNQVGKDYFRFNLTKYGILPTGTSSYQSGYTFTSNGFGTTAWVIYNGNLDYSRCGGLSWSGPTTCP